MSPSDEKTFAGPFETRDQASAFAAAHGASGPVKSGRKQWWVETDAVTDAPARWRFRLTHEAGIFTAFITRHFRGATTEYTITKDGIADHEVWYLGEAVEQLLQEEQKAARDAGVLRVLERLVNDGLLAMNDGQHVSVLLRRATRPLDRFVAGRVAPTVQLAHAAQELEKVLLDAREVDELFATREQLLAVIEAELPR